jgi:polyvinyl alcohol dehydrogenase (cytochrome)
MGHALRLGIGAFVVLMLTAASNNIVWLEAGQGQANWRYQPMELTISPQNAGNLKVKWANAGGDVSATPSVSDGIVYYPDWAGNLYAVDANTGAVVWQDNLAQVSGISGAYSRTTPTIDGGVLYVGLQKQGWMLAIKRNSGTLIWKTQLDTHVAAVISQSPADFNGILFVGMSSLEESFATNPNYPCCSFRGSVSAISEKTGQVLWKTYTVPSDPAGYSGGSVWGSIPVVDSARKLVYITTGNNYTVPADVAGGTTLLDSTDYVDSILALDMNTGKVVWAAPHLGLPDGDAWTVGCILSDPVNCPDNAGPDYDFGQGVMEVTANVNGVKQTLVIAGQKSGKLWALNADTGQTVWMYDSGVGSTLGGMEWGSATDGTTVYFANSAGSFWGAVDIATGQLKWKTSDPNPISPATFFVNDIAAVSVANGVVYAGSLASGDTTHSSMFALDAATGQILWQYASGSSVGSGPAIVNGMVYWGTGYSLFGTPAGEHNFYAFSVK